MNMGNKTGTYRCKHCNLELPSFSELSKHLRANHPETFKRTKEATIPCRLGCGKKFTNNAGRRNHEQNTCPNRPGGTNREALRPLPKTETEEVIKPPTIELPKNLSSEDLKAMIDNLSDLTNQKLQGITSNNGVTPVNISQKEVPETMADLKEIREEINFTVKPLIDAMTLQNKMAIESLQLKLDGALKNMEDKYAKVPQPVLPQPITTPQPTQLESEIHQLIEVLKPKEEVKKEVPVSPELAQISQGLQELTKTNQELCKQFPELCQRIDKIEGYRREREPLPSPPRRQPIPEPKKVEGKGDDNNIVTKPCPDCGHVFEKPIIPHNEGIKGAYSCPDCKTKIMTQITNLAKENEDFRKDLKGLVNVSVQGGLKE